MPQRQHRFYESFRLIVQLSICASIKFNNRPDFPIPGENYLDIFLRLYRQS